MTHDPADNTAHTSDAQQAYKEAAERARRVQLWFDGVLAGKPPVTDETAQWREGFPIYSDADETAVAGTGDVFTRSAEAIEDTLLKIRRRIRERRELSGKLLPDITEEEQERRSAQMLELLRANPSEPTPLHLVLLARYVEGEIDFEQYRVAALRSNAD